MQQEYQICSVLETFIEDGKQFRVIDLLKSFPFPIKKRHISFKIPGERSYNLYSGVYLDEKIVFQPIFRTPQVIVDRWSQTHILQNALVLGCAGCSFPRFLALRYENINIVGIELSAKQIEIAHKYFWIDKFDKKFKIYQQDALLFVKNASTYDVIFVDLFNGASVVEGIYEQSFINDLVGIMERKSIAIINCLGEQELLAKFVSKVKLPPYVKGQLVEENRRNFFVLEKYSDSD